MKDLKILHIILRSAFLIAAGILVPAVFTGCGVNNGASSELTGQAGRNGGNGFGMVRVQYSEQNASDFFQNHASKATAVASSSADPDKTGPERAIDGNPETAWTGTQASDQIVLDFGEPVSYSYLRIIWDSIDISGYRLESSDDGTDFSVFYSSDYPPYLSEDLIDLTENAGTGSLASGTASAASSTSSAVTSRYLRITVNGTAQISEIEVYDGDPWKEVFDDLSVSLSASSAASAFVSSDSTGHSISASSSAFSPELGPVDASEQVVLSGVPSGILVNYGGCNYEQIVDGEGTIHRPLEEKAVQVGYELTFGNWTVPTPDLPLTVPAEEEEEETPAAEDGDHEINARPDVTPEIQEWRGGRGFLILDSDTEAFIRNFQETDPEAEDAGQRAGNGTFTSGQINVIFREEAEFAPGAEGYEIEIGEDEIGITVCSDTGLLWTIRTLQQMTEKAKRDSSGLILLPEGKIRDYPEYSSRGFEIDAARSFVSMDTLYRMAFELSRLKMNEFTIHLSDNEIITGDAGGQTESEIFSKRYAAYRMESAITSETRLAGSAGTDSNGSTDRSSDNSTLSGPESGDGTNVEPGADADGTLSDASGGDESDEAGGDPSAAVSITAPDGSYSQEEFAGFVSYAASIGVKVIPEIDTPAHSLAFTRVFPELAEHYQAEAVQYLDVTKPETLSLVKQIWSEQLDSAFSGCSVVHLGGDEYYGDASGYVTYETSLIRWMEERGKTPRIWGSLSRLQGQGASRVPADGTQMIVWNTGWADPELMMRAGFSLINADNTYTYIVPNGQGTGADYLDKEAFEDNYHVNQFTNANEMANTESSDSKSASETVSDSENNPENNSEQNDTSTIVLPSWTTKLLGGQFTLWNDYSRALGISEDGIYERFADALPVVSGRLWKD